MAASAAIIVAAGSSQRFGEDKLMALAQGQPIISYSLRTFAAISDIEEIVLVVAENRKEFFAKLLCQMGIAGGEEKIILISGGQNRHESVQKGLQAFSSNIKWVAIHDGARPLVSRSMIELAFQKAREHGAASLAARVTDTLHQSNEHHLATKTVDRRDLWAMQTPQVFRKADLISLPASNPSPTDEVSSLLEQGKKVYLVENREPNLKVTYPHDLELVKAYLSIARKP